MWTALVILLLEVHAVGAGWIDPDTPRSAYTTQALSSFVPPYTAPTELKSDENVTTPFPTDSPTSTPTMAPTQTERFELVFSDEFNVPGRTFEDGADPRWTALNKNDYTNNALHYYHPSMAQTDSNGDLIIKTNANKTKFIGFNDTSQKRMRATKNFKSAMLQTWNKFCFTGGIIEGQFQMPGKSRVGGLWPAFWLMGNLARHTYVGTSGHVWPWSSRDCSSISRSAQKISGCDRVLHYGLHNGMGRGSPEIDIFEMQPGNLTHNQGPFLRTAVGQPFMSASYQVAPGRPYNRPGPGYWPGPGQWYSGLKGGKNTSLNILFYGNYNYFAPKSPLPRGPYWSDAISFNRQVDESYFNRRHIYRLEWEVPSDTTDGSLHWFLDGELVLSINGTGIVEAGLGMCSSKFGLSFSCFLALISHYLSISLTQGRAFRQSHPTYSSTRRYPRSGVSLPSALRAALARNTIAILPTTKTRAGSTMGFATWSSKNQTTRLIGCAFTRTPTTRSTRLVARLPNDPPKSTLKPTTTYTRDEKM